MLKPPPKLPQRGCGISHAVFFAPVASAFPQRTSPMFWIISDNANINCESWCGSRRAHVFREVVQQRRKNVDNFFPHRRFWTTWTCNCASISFQIAVSRNMQRAIHRPATAETPEASSATRRSDDSRRGNQFSRAVPPPAPEKRRNPNGQPRPLRTNSSTSPNSAVPAWLFPASWTTSWWFSDKRKADCDNASTTASGSAATSASTSAEETDDRAAAQQRADATLKMARRTLWKWTRVRDFISEEMRNKFRAAPAKEKASTLRRGFLSFGIQSQSPKTMKSMVSVMFVCMRHGSVTGHACV